MAEPPAPAPRPTPWPTGAHPAQPAAEAGGLPPVGGPGTNGRPHRVESGPYPAPRSTGAYPAQPAAEAGGQGAGTNGWVHRAEPAPRSTGAYPAQPAAETNGRPPLAEPPVPPPPRPTPRSTGAYPVQPAGEETGLLPTTGRWAATNGRRHPAEPAGQPTGAYPVEPAAGLPAGPAPSSGSYPVEPGPETTGRRRLIDPAAAQATGWLAAEAGPGATGRRRRVEPTGAYPRSSRPNQVRRLVPLADRASRRTGCRGHRAASPGRAARAAHPIESARTRRGRDIRVAAGCGGHGQAPGAGAGGRPVAAGGACVSGGRTAPARAPAGSDRQQVSGGAGRGLRWRADGARAPRRLRVPVHRVVPRRVHGRSRGAGWPAQAPRTRRRGHRGLAAVVRRGAVERGDGPQAPRGRRLHRHRQASPARAGGHGDRIVAAGRPRRADGGVHRQAAPRRAVRGVVQSAVGHRAARAALGQAPGREAGSAGQSPDPRRGVPDRHRRAGRLDGRRPAVRAPARAADRAVHAGTGAVPGPTGGGRAAGGRLRRTCCRGTGRLGTSCRRRRAAAGGTTHPRTARA